MQILSETDWLQEGGTTLGDRDRLYPLLGITKDDAEAAVGSAGPKPAAAVAKPVLEGYAALVKEMHGAS